MHFTPKQFGKKTEVQAANYKAVSTEAVKHQKAVIKP